MSQYNALDRSKEIVSALQGHNGATVSLNLGPSTITGTLDTSQLANDLVKVTDGSSKLWTVSTFSIVAVGI